MWDCTIRDFALHAPTALDAIEDADRECRLPPATGIEAADQRGRERLLRDWPGHHSPWNRCNNAIATPLVTLSHARVAFLSFSNRSPVSALLNREKEAVDRNGEYANQDRYGNHCGYIIDRNSIHDHVA